MQHENQENGGHNHMELQSQSPNPESKKNSGRGNNGRGGLLAEIQSRPTLNTPQRMTPPVKIQTPMEKRLASIRKSTKPGSESEGSSQGSSTEWD